MKVICIPKLKKYAVMHVDVKSRIGAWLNETKVAVWKSKSEIIQRFPKTKFLGNNQVIFEIKIGKTKHKIVTKIAFRVGIVKIEELFN